MDVQYQQCLVFLLKNSSEIHAEKLGALDKGLVGLAVLSSTSGYMFLQRLSSISGCGCKNIKFEANKTPVRFIYRLLQARFQDPHPHRLCLGANQNHCGYALEIRSPELKALPADSQTDEHFRSCSAARVSSWTLFERGFSHPTDPLSLHGRFYITKPPGDSVALEA